MLLRSAEGETLPAEALLDGRRSLDPDGAPITTYRWAQLGGPVALPPPQPEQAFQLLRLPSPGLYVYSLVVAAGGQESAPDQVHIEVLPALDGNRPPRAQLVVSPQQVAVGEDVLFDASDSSDPDPGDRVNAFRWSVALPGGGAEDFEGGPRVRFQPALPGRHSVTVRVRDQGGLEDLASAEFDAFFDCAEGATELCNGLDDDCDQAVDEDLVPPAASLQQGVCQGAVQRCGGADGWLEPDYAERPDYEVEETRCDGLDNDCDGEIDEGFDRDGDGRPDCQGCLDAPLLGQPCDPFGCGGGRWVCRGAESTELACEPLLSWVDRPLCGDFQRGSPALYLRDAAGHLGTAGVDEPRTEYDLRLGGPAMLAEGARSNLLANSRSLAAAEWRFYRPEEGLRLFVEPSGLSAPDGGPSELLRFEGLYQSVNQTGLGPLGGSWLTASFYGSATERPAVLQLEAGNNVALLQDIALDATWRRFSGTRSWPAEEVRQAGFVLRRVGPPQGEAWAWAWGPQLEYGSFPSSYIPTSEQERGERASDEARVPAAVLSAAAGTYVVWVRPLYPTGAPDPDLRLLLLNEQRFCRYRGGSGLVSCSVDGATVALAAPDFGAGPWSFVALTWQAGHAAHLFLGPAAGALGHATTPLGPPAAGPSALAASLLPLYAHSRDLRLWDRALDADEVEALFSAERADYP